VEELVLPGVEHVDIGPAVVVVVADRYAHAIALARHAGFLRHVGEGPIVIVMVQAIPVLGAFLLERRDGRAIHQIDVQIAVVVVVEQRHAGHHGLGLILVRGGRTVGDESQAGALRDLFENDGARGGPGQKRAGSDYNRDESFHVS
jgi:hypothetical protein